VFELKKDTKWILLGIFGLAFLVIVAIFAATRTTVPITIPAGQVPITGGEEPLASCSFGNAQALYLSATDKGQPATAVTLSAAKVYQQQPDGSYKYIGSYANNTAIAISPNVRYYVYATASNYYPIYFTGVTTCGPTTNKVFSMAHVDTSFSLTVLNSDGVTKNTNTSAEAIGTGGSAHPQIQMVGGTAYAYGTDPAYNHGYIDFVWNTSAFDASNLQAKLDGVACGFENIRIGRSGTANAAIKCTGNIFNGERHYLDLTIYALSGVNPVYTGGAGNAIVMYWCPYTTAQDTVSDAVLQDKTENNVGAAVGTCQTLASYYYT